MRRPRLVWATLAMVALAALAYANADHEQLLFDSKHIAQVEEIGGPGEALAEFWAGRLNPDASLSFLTFAWNAAFNRAVGLESFDVTTFLAVNVLLHALNALLLMVLLGELLRQDGVDHRFTAWAPLALAALFLVHPMHAGSVAYIIQRRGLLATLFYLLGVLCFLLLRQRWSRAAAAAAGAHRQNLAGLVWLAGILLCWWLSFRAKNFGLTLPLTLLVIELCWRAREETPWRRGLAPLAGAFLVGAGGILAFLGRRGYLDATSFSLGHFGPEPAWGPWQHLLTEARVFVHYWKLLLLPLPGWSSVDHQVAVSQSILEPGAAAAVLFHLLILALAVVAARRGVALLAMGIGWFYVALVPYAFVPQVELFAEYKTYLPSIGLVLIAAAALHEAHQRVSARVLVAGLSVLIALALAVTMRRNVIYQSRVNLWTDAVRKAPAKWRPHYNLGSSLIEEGLYLEAESHLAEAVRLDPELYPAHSNLAGVLALQGRHDEAIVHYLEVVRLQPDWPKAHYRLANALVRADRLAEAVEHYSKATELEPGSVEAHANLAAALAEMGRLAEAVDRFEMAVKLRPDSAELLQRLRRSRERAAAQGPAESGGESSQPVSEPTPAPPPG